MAQSTQLVHDMAMSSIGQTKMVANEITQGQKMLQAEIWQASTKIDKLLTTSAELSREMKRMEIESTSLPDLESWITITTSEFEHMRAQVKFIEEAMEDVKKNSTSKPDVKSKREPL